MNWSRINKRFPNIYPELKRLAGAYSKLSDKQLIKKFLELNDLDIIKSGRSPVNLLKRLEANKQRQLDRRRRV